MTSSARLAGSTEKPAGDLCASFAAWYMLAVVTLLLIMSFVDRTVLVLLVAPVRRDLHLSDTQFSFLLGASFSVLYAAFALPVGYIVDRFPRRSLLLAGSLVWTTMTLASAFAPTFLALFVCRMGVGVGEAILSPAAYSMIRDAFPYRQRALALGLHNVGAPVGNGVSLVVVGALMTLDGRGVASLPVLSHLPEWRTVLALVGLGGIPVALLLLTIVEPERQAAAQGETAAVAAVWRRFLGIRWVYVGTFAATAFYGVGYFGLTSWLPTALSRLYGLPIAHVGSKLGGLQLTLAPIGLLMGGAFLTLLLRHGSKSGAPLAGGAAMLLAGALTALWPRGSDETAGWAMIGAIVFLLPWLGVACATILAAVTPSRMMGKITAVNFLMLSLVGMAAGPTLNAILAEHLFAGPSAMGHAIGVGSGGCFALSGACLLWVARAMRSSAIAVG